MTFLLQIAKSIPRNAPQPHRLRWPVHSSADDGRRNSTKSTTSVRQKITQDCTHKKKKFNNIASIFYVALLQPGGRRRELIINVCLFWPHAVNSDHCWTGFFPAECIRFTWVTCYCARIRHTTSFACSH